MYVYSNKLTEHDLDVIAETMGVRVERGEFFGARRRRCTFVIRPSYGTRRESWRATRRGRKANAVSWAAHYVYMRALYFLDPGAEIRSAVARYSNVCDFAERAYSTQYRDAFMSDEGEEHIGWRVEEDLEHIAADVAADVLAAR